MDLADAAHRAAVREFYPALTAAWGIESYDLLDTSALGNGNARQFLDHELGIDVVLRGESAIFSEAVPLFIQERWRRAKYAGYRELTMTVAKPGNGLPPQVTRMLAPLFVYGYYHEPADELCETVVVDTMRVYRAIFRDELPTTEVAVTANKTRMLAIPFDALAEADAILFHFRAEAPPDVADKFDGFLE